MKFETCPLTTPTPNYTSCKNRERK